MNVQEKKRLTGRIAAENIKLMAVPRPPQGVVERFIALGDPTGIIADTMDELGIPLRRHRRLGAQADHSGQDASSGRR